MLLFELMVDYQFYNGVMFMHFQEACKIQWDAPERHPRETRPAESRIFVKDFDTSRSALPEFGSNPERIHQTCCLE